MRTLRPVGLIFVALAGVALWLPPAPHHTAGVLLLIVAGAHLCFVSDDGFRINRKKRKKP